MAEVSTLTVKVRRWKTFIVPLAVGCTLIVFGHFYLPSRFVEPNNNERIFSIGTASQERLRLPIDVLVWNICKGSKQNYTADISKLSKDKQLVLLQEFHRNEVVDSSIAGMGYLQFQVATSFLFRKDRAPTGVATGAAALPISVDYRVTKYREPIAKTPKAILICEYALLNCTDRLLVINLHGINIAGFNALRSQLESIRSLVRNHQGPVLLGGDFNTNTTKKLEFVLRFVDECGLSEVEFSDGARMTAPFGSIPLDYVFTRGLKISSANVRVDLAGSDHKALVLTIDELADDLLNHDSQPTN